ncbi:MAG: hypothetical protein KGJ78_09010 [Alphaproteobacteria bacterium]|nr:hypothetical protein [Alphaproteobacteria bacterium]
MAKSSGLVWWTSRLISLLIIILLWWMAIGETVSAQARGLPFAWTGLIPFLILVPVTVVIGLAWRWAWVGTAFFGLLAVIVAGLAGLHIFGLIQPTRPPNNMLVVFAALVVLGLLYNWSWNRRRAAAS